MVNREYKDEQPASDKSDDQIISDLIENRKRQMEALIKIMSSIEEGDEKPEEAKTKKNKAKGRK